MNWAEIKFTPKEIIQGVLLIAPMILIWSDIRTSMAISKKEREFLQYQVDQVKKCCGLAILPKETHIESEQ